MARAKHAHERRLLLASIFCNGVNTGCNQQISRHPLRADEVKMTAPMEC